MLFVEISRACLSSIIAYKCIVCIVNCVFVCSAFVNNTHRQIYGLPVLRGAEDDKLRNAFALCSTPLQLRESSID